MFLEVLLNVSHFCEQVSSILYLIYSMGLNAKTDMIKAIVLRLSQSLESAGRLLKAQNAARFSPSLDNTSAYLTCAREFTPLTSRWSGFAILVLLIGGPHIEMITVVSYSLALLCLGFFTSYLRVQTPTSQSCCDK